MITTIYASNKLIVRQTLKVCEFATDLQQDNHIFLPTNPIASQTSKKYPLYWNTSKFSKADIVSLLTALDAVEAVVDKDGRRIPFNHLAQVFENTLNVQLPRIHKARYDLLGRGDSRLKFLRLLLKLLGDIE